MRRRLPTSKQGSVLALIALLAASGVATQLGAADGDAFASCSPADVRPAFEICGELAGPLTPGTSQPIDMRISNHTRHRLRITRITASLKLGTSDRRAACAVAESFRVAALRAEQYPIVVPPRSTRSLRELGVKPLPRVRMLNLASSQDACKAVKLRMDFRGDARRFAWIGRT